MRMGKKKRGKRRKNGMTRVSRKESTKHRTTKERCWKGKSKTKMQKIES